jgi:hypothetical protein
VNAPGAADALGFPRGPVSLTSPYAMNGVEIATCLVRGSDPAVAALPRGRSAGGRVRAALQAVLVRALRRPPCLVAFSGGLDSSAILAAATAAARARGLPLPIPATNRFPGIPAVDESRWQEMMVAHLGLSEWVRVDVTDELDVVGPAAAPALLAHGVLWPPNAHFLRPLAAHAAGGTLLTGIGGDELFTPAASRGARVLAREVQPRRSDLRAVAEAVAPRRLRRLRARPAAAPPPWLRPEGRRRWTAVIAEEMSSVPLWWGRSVLEHWWRSRARLAVVGSVSAAAGRDVTVLHPFMDPGFAGAIADARWRTGFRSRAAALELLCGDGVPRALRERSDKTAFFGPFVHRHSRAFIDRWDGTGVDLELIDPEALRETWLQEEVDARSYPALQAAWLAHQRN